MPFDSGSGSYIVIKISKVRKKTGTEIAFFYKFFKYFFRIFGLGYRVFYIFAIICFLCFFNSQLLNLFI